MKAALLLVLLAAAGLPAAQSGYGGAQSGSRWLEVQASPRAAALAGAYTALAEGSDSPGFNPAGLAGLTAAQLDLDHNFWILDLSQERLAVAEPLAGWGVAALSLDYFNLGSVESVSLSPGGQPLPQGYLHPYASALGLNWGRRIGGDLAVGLGAKALTQDLGTGTSSDLAADLGARWTPGRGPICIGLAALDLGGTLDGASLPANLRLGLAYHREDAPYDLTADLGFVPQEPSPTLSLGEEYWVAKILVLRAGYQFASGTLPHGPGVGFGLRHQGLELDYAFDDRGQLAGLQQLGLTVNFGGPATAPAPQSNPVPTVTAVPTPAPALQALRDLHQLLNALDQDDTRTASTLTQALGDQVLPVRQALAQQVKTGSVQPAFFNGEFAEAKRSLQVMIQLDRNNSYNYQALGNVEWFLGDEAAALEDLRRAYLLDPSRNYLKIQIQRLGGTVPAPAP